jgi:16S rRNA (uracil1498-N3)-methyltransferase
LRVRRRFFVEKFDHDAAALRGEQAHHLGRVLRAEPGQLFELSDGGAVWLARVERVAREEISFSLVEPIPAGEPVLRLALLLSVVKFDRFEWALEKATELGVDVVVPLAASRSEKALIVAAPKRSERWRRILLESAQQSRRLRPPSLALLQRASEAFSGGRTSDSPAAALLPEAGQFDLSILLSEARDAPALRLVLEGKRTGGRVPSVRLAVGPEGGWTEAEEKLARGACFAPASLGGNILRTETAVVAALAAVNYALCG